MNELNSIRWERFSLEEIPGLACVCCVRKDGDLVLIKENRRYQELLGHQGLEPVWKSLTETKRSQLRANLLHSASARSEFQYTGQAVCADGITRRLSISAMILERTVDQVIFIGIVEDFTKSMLHNELPDGKEDEAVPYDLQKLDRPFDVFPLGVARVCLEQDQVRVCCANPAFFRMIGYMEEDFYNACENYLNRLSVYPEEFTKAIQLRKEDFYWIFRGKDGRIGSLAVHMSPVSEDEKDWYLILNDNEQIVAAELEKKRLAYFGEIFSRYQIGGVLIRHAETLEPLLISPNIPLLLGYSTEEFQSLLHSDYRNLLAPEDGMRIHSLGMSVHLPVPEYELEYRARKKDGTYLWVSDHTKLERYYDGTLIYFSILVNITKRKENEIQLRAREQEYRLAIKQCDKVLFRYDLAAKRLEITGQSAERLGVQNVLEDVPQSILSMGKLAPESVVRYQTFHAEIQRGEPSGETLLRGKVNDGNYRWFLVRFAMTYADDGTAVSAVGTYEDITDRYEKEEMLKRLCEEHEMLQAIVAHSGRTVFKFDIAEQMAYLDEETAARFGLMKAIRIRDEHDLHLEQVAKESQKTYIAFYKSILQGNPAGSARICRKDATGCFSWYQVDFTLVKDVEGQPAYAVVSFKDINDRYALDLANCQLSQYFERFAPDQYSYYVFNLTRDRCDQEMGALIKCVRDKSDGSLDGVVQRTVERFISPQSEADYRKFNNRFRLLQSYAEGRKKEELEFLAVLDGQEIWVRENVRMFQDPYSSDVRGVFHIINIDADKRQLLSLRQRAERDWLTRLLNRYAFCDQVNRMNENTEMYNAFLMLDLDHFKTVNDVDGHLEGDRLLMNLSQVMSAMLRSYDLLGRLEGDNFLIYLTNIPDASLAMRRADSICKAVRNRYAEKMGVTASIGVALFPQDGQTYDELYAHADKGLYTAKKNGGDRFIHIERETNVPSEERLSEEEPKEAKRIFIRTFGYFDLFVDNEPLSFSSAKAKELLAILVDRRGGILSSSEAVSLLWEDEPLNKTTLSRYRKVALRLKQSLDKAGIGGILLSRNDGRCVDISRFTCDYYLYMEGAASGQGLFRGSYMNNYSWGETTLAALEAAEN